MKKLPILVLAAMLALTMPALAHGSQHGRQRSQSAAVCPTQSCTLTGLHMHGVKAYYAHFHGDGHDYHDYCSIEGCTTAGYHSHNGEYCFGHTAKDGHGHQNKGAGHH